jgi:hypothetical protein
MMGFINQYIKPSGSGSREDNSKICLSDFDHGFPHTFLSGTQFGEEDDVQEQVDGPGDVWLTQIMGTFDCVEEVKPIKPQ